MKLGRDDIALTYGNDPANARRARNVMNALANLGVKAELLTFPETEAGWVHVCVPKKQRATVEAFAAGYRLASSVEFHIHYGRPESLDMLDGVGPLDGGGS